MFGVIVTVVVVVLDRVGRDRGASLAHVVCARVRAAR